MTPDLEQLRGFAEDYTAAWCSMDPVAVAAMTLWSPQPPSPTVNVSAFQASDTLTPRPCLKS